MGKEKRHRDKGKKQSQGEQGKKQSFGELEETLKRLQAEFENSRKRFEREKQQFLKHANAGLVKGLLPLLDSMNSAEKSIKEQESISKEKAVEGIELIKRQLLAILKTQGLEEIKSLGEKFDPQMQECVMQGCEKGREDGLVLEELQKGYMLNGKVLRHAKVRVNKK